MILLFISGLCCELFLLCIFLCVISMRFSVGYLASHLESLAIIFYALKQIK